jgi:hypothetical protein
VCVCGGVCTTIKDWGGGFRQARIQWGVGKGGVAWQHQWTEQRRYRSCLLLRWQVGAVFLSWGGLVFFGGGGMAIDGMCVCGGGWHGSIHG